MTTCYYNSEKTADRRIDDNPQPSCWGQGYRVNNTVIKKQEENNRKPKSRQRAMGGVAYGLSRFEIDSQRRKEKCRQQGKGGKKGKRKEADGGEPGMYSELQVLISDPQAEPIMQPRGCLGLGARGSTALKYSKLHTANNYSVRMYKHDICSCNLSHILTAVKGIKSDEIGDWSVRRVT